MNSLRRSAGLAFLAELAIGFTIVANPQALQHAAVLGWILIAGAALSLISLLAELIETGRPL